MSIGVVIIICVVGEERLGVKLETVNKSVLLTHVQVVCCVILNNRFSRRSRRIDGVVFYGWLMLKLLGHNFHTS